MNSSKIFINGFIYTVGNALNALLPLILIPFLTKELDNNDYAKIATFQMLVFFLTPILSLESISAVARSYFDKSISLPIYITSAISASASSAVMFTICTILIYALSDANAYVEFEIISAAALYCLLIYPCNLVLAILINRGEPLKYSLLAIFTFLINLALTLLLFYMFDSNANLRIYAQIITGAILGLCCTAYIIRSKLVARAVSKLYIRDILKFSSPLIVHTLGGSLLGMGPQLALTFYGLTTSVSDYSIALQIGSAIGLMCVGANKAIAPWLQHNYELSGNVVSSYTRIISLSWVFAIVLFLIYLAAESFIIQILNLYIDSRYFGYSLYLKWVVIGFLANGIYLLYVNILVCRRQTFALASMSSLSGLLGLGVSFATVYWAGSSLAGLGISTAFVMLAVSVGVYATRMEQDNTTKLNA